MIKTRTQVMKRAWQIYKAADVSFGDAQRSAWRWGASSLADFGLGRMIRQGVYKITVAGGIVVDLEKGTAPGHEWALSIPAIVAVVDKFAAHRARVKMGRARCAVKKQEHKPARRVALAA